MKQSDTFEDMVVFQYGQSKSWEKRMLTDETGQVGRLRTERTADEFGLYPSGFVEPLKHFNKGRT